MVAIAEYLVNAGPADPPPRPVALPVDPDGIPAAMKAERRWLVWGYTLRNGKWSKVPYAATGGPASSTDPTTWCDFNPAWQAYLRGREQGRLDGVGFVLGDDFAGLDLDDHRDPETGALDDFAVRVLSWLPSPAYVEVSPSGTGCKAFLRGAAPPGRSADHTAGVEMYGSGRYFAVTGRPVPGSGTDLLDGTAALAYIHRTCLSGPPAAAVKMLPPDADDADKAREALRHLAGWRADDHETWIRVGMALHATDAGLLGAWDLWSRSSEKWSAGECKRRWESFSSTGGIGLGTLLAWAKQDTGWTPTREAKSTGSGDTTPGIPEEFEVVSPCHQPAAWKSFPTGVLPAALRRFIRSAADCIGCDESYVALPLLSMLSAAVGSTRRIRLKLGWTEPAVLWTAIVGDSGQHKSPALDIATRPTKKRQERALKQHEEDVKRFKEALLVHERDLAAWKKRSVSGPPPEAPEPPACPRTWTADITIEAMAGLLKHNPRGPLVLRDELAGWMQGFDRYANGGGESAKWIEMHGGRALVVDRKTTGTTYIPRACVPLTGGIQPEILRGCLTREHRESGLAARLLFSHPPRRPRRWTDAEMDPGAERALAALVDRLYELEHVHDDEGNPVPVDLPLSRDARHRFASFVDSHGDEQMETSGALSAAWSKLEGYAARLALVLHLTRWASGEDVSADEVDDISIEAGIALSDWFGGEARRMYQLIDEDEDGRDRRELMEMIESRGDGRCVPRDLMRWSRSRFAKVDDAKSALDDLAKRGFGRWEPVPTSEHGGRPTRVFALLASVTGDTTSRIPQKPGVVSPTADEDTPDPAPVDTEQEEAPCEVF